MALDFTTACVGRSQDRHDMGRTGYLSGMAAEDRVEREYARRGYPAIARRWRGRAGEVDLVLRDGDGLVFVEVKKSRSFARAVERLTARQIGRLTQAAEEFVGTQPLGSLTDVRFDVVLVDGSGQLRVIENALAC